MTEYDGRNVSAVSFRMRVGSNDMAFKMPCNWRAVLQVFRDQGLGTGKIRHKDKSIENQAIRTAWRIIKVWVESQLALVEVNMVTIPQVFLPYAITRDGRTLAEKITDEPEFLLGSGNSI
jgi:hypothetical protein